MKNQDTVTYIEIKMLGEFFVRYGDTVIVSKETRASKVVNLFAFLCCNLNKMVTRDKIVDAVLFGEVAGDPFSVVKNLIYRLRMLFKEYGLPKDCIRFRKKSYGLFLGDDITVDTNLFLDYAERAYSADNSVLQDEMCTRAISLYNNSFLFRFSYDPWVLERSVRFQNKYLDLFETLLLICEKNNDYSRMPNILSYALTIYPYEQRLHVMLIDCFYILGRTKDALCAYDRLVAMEYNEFGANPSADILKLYNKISVVIAPELPQTITEVQDTCTEKETIVGPYLCELCEFVAVYQFLSRYMERSGKSIFLMLCTFSESDSTSPEKGKRAGAFATAMQGAIFNTCRRSDCFARYSATQFVIMFPEISIEECAVVEKRLLSSFYSMPKMGRTRLTCKSISAVPGEIFKKNKILLSSWN